MTQYSCHGRAIFLEDNQPVRIRPPQHGGLFFVTVDAAIGKKFILGEHGASALTVPLWRDCKSQTATSIRLSTREAPYIEHPSGAVHIGIALRKGNLAVYHNGAIPVPAAALQVGNLSSL